MSGEVADDAAAAVAAADAQAAADEAALVEIEAYTALPENRVQAILDDAQESDAPLSALALEITDEAVQAGLLSRALCCPRSAAFRASAFRTLAAAWPDAAQRNCGPLAEDAFQRGPVEVLAELLTRVLDETHENVSQTAACEMRSGAPAAAPCLAAYSLLVLSCCSLMAG